MQVSLFLFRGLCAYLRDQDISSETLLREAGLSSGLELPSGYVDLQAMNKATRAAYRLTGDPALALHMGSNVPPQTVSAVGQLFVQCATLREALAAVQRYMPLIASTGQYELHEEDGVARLVYRAPEFQDYEQRFAIELGFAFIVSAARQFLGRNIVPLRMCLPFPKPSYVAEYEALFRCPLTFEAEAAEGHFDRSYLDREQMFANARVHRLLREQAESMLLSEVRTEPLHMRVRAILREEELTLGEKGRQMLAKRLGISARSLRRRLSREGQTLWSLLEDARKEHAFYLLGESDTPLKHIAERLGFSEPSAFHRAFKRWTGQTPVQYRLDHQRTGTSLAC